MKDKLVTKAEERERVNWIRSHLFCMNAMINGLVGALIFGGGLAVATLWLVIKGGVDVGRHLGLLNNFFPGYSVTYFGSLVGFGYGVLVGFLLGYTASRVYNFFLYRRQGKRDEG